MQVFYTIFGLLITLYTFDNWAVSCMPLFRKKGKKGQSYYPNQEEYNDDQQLVDTPLQLPLILADLLLNGGSYYQFEQPEPPTETPKPSRFKRSQSSKSHKSQSKGSQSRSSTPMSDSSKYGASSSSSRSSTPMSSSSANKSQGSPATQSRSNNHKRSQSQSNSRSYSQSNNSTDPYKNLKPQDYNHVDFRTDDNQFGF